MHFLQPTCFHRTWPWPSEAPDLQFGHKSWWHRRECHLTLKDIFRRWFHCALSSQSWSGMTRDFSFIISCYCFILMSLTDLILSKKFACLTVEGPEVKLASKIGGCDIKCWSKSVLSVKVSKLTKSSNCWPKVVNIFDPGVKRIIWKNSFRLGCWRLCSKAWAGFSKLRSSKIKSKYRFSISDSNVFMCAILTLDLDLTLVSLSALDIFSKTCKTESDSLSWTNWVIFWLCTDFTNWTSSGTKCQ